MVNPSPTVMRSQLGQARGLGAARTGTATWWAERVTSLALLPLTIWFVIDMLRLHHQPRAVVLHWAANPVNATLLLALVLTTFHHMQLGLQAVIEDYVHVEATKMISLLAMKAIVALMALASVVAVLKMAFAG